MLAHTRQPDSWDHSLSRHERWSTATCVKANCFTRAGRVYDREIGGSDITGSRNTIVGNGMTVGSRGGLDVVGAGLGEGIAMVGAGGRLGATVKVVLVAVTLRKGKALTERNTVSVTLAAGALVGLASIDGTKGVSGGVIVVGAEVTGGLLGANRYVFTGGTAKMATAAIARNTVRIHLVVCL